MNLDEVLLVSIVGVIYIYGSFVFYYACKENAPIITEKLNNLLINKNIADIKEPYYLDDKVSNEILLNPVVTNIISNVNVEIGLFSVSFLLWTSFCLYSLLWCLSSSEMINLIIEYGYEIQENLPMLEIQEAIIKNKSIICENYNYLPKEIILLDNTSRDSLIISFCDYLLNNKSISNKIDIDFIIEILGDNNNKFYIDLNNKILMQEEKFIFSSGMDFGYKVLLKFFSKIEYFENITLDDIINNKTYFIKLKYIILNDYKGCYDFDKFF